MRAIPTAVVTNEQFYFQPGITWGTVTTGRFSARLFGNGFLFDNGGCCVFGANDRRLYLLGLLNSTTFEHVVGSINPTVNFQSGEVSKLPVIFDDKLALEVEQAVRRLTVRAKGDWDSQEVSWNFREPFWTRLVTATVADCFRAECNEIANDLNQQSQDQELINKAFARIYGIEGEVATAVTVDELLPNRAVRRESGLRACQDLLSYALGCMMGRYSLDEPGLIYAHAGGEGFDPSRYRTFPADEDGILPLTDQAFFGDQDTAERFAQWVHAVWPNSSLEENLAFIADNLGKKSDETPLEAIRRYLNEDFYADHLQTYKKRPIYWLFSSGKKRAFQALVYLHRYHPGTLGRMRSHYVQPLIGKLQAQLQQAEASAEAASSGSEKARRQREAKKLREQYDELLGFDERLHHYALQAIALDLDDGVKVNYGKFSDPKVGDILAKVKDITGGKDD